MGQLSVLATAALSYNRIPKSVIKRDLEDTSVEIWQREWGTTKKGRITND